MAKGIQDADTAPVTRTDVQDMMKVLTRFRDEAFKAIEQGEAPANIKRQLREKLGAGVHVLRGALDEVERYAKKEVGP